jgi:hypothetical protein
VPTFPAETIAAVLAHMNGEHPDDNLLIVRAFGAPDAEAAELTSLDHRGGTWTYSAEGTRSELIVPWSRQIPERGEIRREVVSLYEQACDRLGLRPRGH